MPLDGSVGVLFVRAEAKSAGDCLVFTSQFCFGVCVCVFVCEDPTAHNLSDLGLCV